MNTINMAAACGALSSAVRGMQAKVAVALLFLSGLAVASVGDVANFDGVGPAHIGASVQELGAALGHRIAIPSDPDDAACFYVDGPKGSGYSFMVEHRRVVRIDVDSPGLKTAAGVQVGDTIATVRRLYPKGLKQVPHFYTGLPDLYITFSSEDGKSAVRFETDSGKVSAYYIGQAKQVEYVEGCS